MGTQGPRPCAGSGAAPRSEPGQGPTQGFGFDRPASGNRRVLLARPAPPGMKRWRKPWGLAENRNPLPVSGKSIFARPIRRRIFPSWRLGGSVGIFCLDGKSLRSGDGASSCRDRPSREAVVPTVPNRDSRFATRGNHWRPGTSAARLQPHMKLILSPEREKPRRTPEKPCGRVVKVR